MYGAAYNYVRKVLKKKPNTCWKDLFTECRERKLLPEGAMLDCFRRTMQRWLQKTALPFLGAILGEMAVFG
jgi:hypothetical protein